MASARSTVSIARTTPAQKPRGEQSTILRSGLAVIGFPGPNHPMPAGRERSDQLTNWGRLRPVSRPFRKPLRCSAFKAYIGQIPVIVDDYRLRQQVVGEAQRRFAMSNAPLMPKATAVW